MPLPWTPSEVTGLAAALLSALAGLPLTGGPRAAEPAPERTWTLAVVPSRPPIDIHREWTPLLERLSADAGIRVQLRLYEAMGQFLDDGTTGTPDLVYASPNLFFLLHERQGYVPLVRSGANVRGLLFVRRDSPARTVEDLRGKRIAFVGPLNVCAVLVRHALSSTGPPIAFTPVFAGSAVNVVKSVLLERADAGAALDGALTGDPRVDVGELRMIVETAPVASHPLAAHPRVPPEVRERLASALFAMNATEDGRRLLSTVRLASPIRADYQRDYAAFGAMDVQGLQAGPR